MTSLSSCLCKSYNPHILKATSKGVTYINKLKPELASNCLSLWISYNSIRCIKNIKQFINLKDLEMEFNLLENIEDLNPLHYLINLQNLNICGNPVTRLPLWEIYVLKNCPNLKFLNKKSVDLIGNTHYSRIELLHLLDFEKEFFSYIFYAKFVIYVLQEKINKPQYTFQKIISYLNRNEIEQQTAEIRNSFLYSNIDSYFAFLRFTLIKHHQTIIELSSTCSPSIFYAHKSLLTSIISINETENFLKQFSHISSTALELIGFGNGLEFKQSVSFQSINQRKNASNFSSEKSFHSENNSIIEAPIVNINKIIQNKDDSIELSDDDPLVSDQDSHNEKLSSNDSNDFFLKAEAEAEKETMQTSEEESVDVIKKIKMSVDLESILSDDQEKDNVISNEISPHNIFNEKNGKINGFNDCIKEETSNPSQITKEEEKNKNDDVKILFSKNFNESKNLLTIRTKENEEDNLTNTSDQSLEIKEKNERIRTIEKTKEKNNSPTSKFQESEISQKGKIQSATDIIDNFISLKPNSYLGFKKIRNSIPSKQRNNRKIFTIIEKPKQFSDDKDQKKKEKHINQKEDKHSQIINESNNIEKSKNDQKLYPKISTDVESNSSKEMNSISKIKPIENPSINSQTQVLILNQATENDFNENDGKKSNNSKIEDFLNHNKFDDVTSIQHANNGKETMLDDCREESPNDDFESNSNQLQLQQKDFLHSSRSKTFDCPSVEILEKNDEKLRKRDYIEAFRLEPSNIKLSQSFVKWKLLYLKKRERKENDELRKKKNEFLYNSHEIIFPDDKISAKDIVERHKLSTEIERQKILNRRMNMRLNQFNHENNIRQISIFGTSMNSSYL